MGTDPNTGGASAHKTMVSDLVNARWSSAQDRRIGTAVALAESGGQVDAKNTKNTNGTEDYGVFQINSVHGFDKDRLLSDANYNADAAYKVWKDAGGKWTPWSTFNSGVYLTKMGQDAELRMGNNGNPLGAVGDAITAPFDAIGDTLSGLDSIADTIGALKNPSTWMRLGKGALGGIVLIIGVGGIVFIVANKVGSSPAVSNAAAVATRGASKAITK